MKLNNSNWLLRKGGNDDCGITSVGGAAVALSWEGEAIAKPDASQFPQNTLQVIHAVYEQGVFRPTDPVELPESCRVELLVQKEPLVSSQATGIAPLANLAAITAAHPG
jgi:predicted DNA-binding antitoxin AbrB/MazE fold protein